MATADLPSRSIPKPRPELVPRTAFLVLDTESVPDGELLARVKYPGKSADEAIDLARQEAMEKNGSDFLPVSFQVPVAVAVLRVGADYSLQSIAVLDTPHYRTPEIARKFWHGVRLYDTAKLVTFNGRGFDLPLMELTAFRYGLDATTYLQKSRNRYAGGIDLLDWLTNFGASRMAGGLDLLAKMIGKPGKGAITGDMVLQLYREGRLREINDYCLCDTLDTYFVFLRTRVMTGDLTRDDEAELVKQARQLVEGKAAELPVLREYLKGW